MGYWNYRFVKIKNEHPLDADEEYIYQLCEVYYNEDGEPYGYCDAGPIYVEEPEERFEQACWVAMAAARDILDVEDINAEPEYYKELNNSDMVILSNTVSLEDFLKELDNGSES